MCVGSIRKNSSYAHQIIVHVNDGSDGTREWLSQQTDIQSSHTADNVGVCYALNQSAQLATRDYLLYLNDDMYACPGWDEALGEEIEAVGHNRFFISATAIERNPQSKCSIGADFGADLRDFEEERLLREFAALPMSDWQGATWPPNVVHRDVWNLVGGYSIEFSPGMYSDPDFSMKLWQAGIRIFKGVSRSRVYHFGSVSVKRVVRNAGYFTFIRKWGMTSGTFTKYYLQRGRPFVGTLDHPDIPVLVHLKNFLKRIGAALKRV